MLLDLGYCTDAEAKEWLRIFDTKEPLTVRLRDRIIAHLVPYKIETHYGLRQGQTHVTLELMKAYSLPNRLICDRDPGDEA